MPATLERPARATGDEPAPRSAPPRPPAPDLLTIEARPPRLRHRSLIERYQQHLWMGLLSVVVIAVALSPFAMGYLGRPSVDSSAGTSQLVPAAPSNLSTSVTITTSEFKFSPTNVQVPVGQKISFTLDNKGVVEHDVTIQAAGFTR